MNRDELMYHIQQARDALSQSWQTAFDKHDDDTLRQILISQEHIEKALRLLAGGHQ